jgi:hypothetical protein
MMVFESFVRDYFTDVEADTDYFRLKDVALSVKSELDLAIALEDGYQRSFFVPLTLDGLEYNITKEADLLMFSSSGAEYTVSTPPYGGAVQKGNNVIRKLDGVVEVNP